MDYYEEEKKARKERAKKEKIREDLQEEFSKAIENGCDYQGIKKVLVSYIVAEVIGESPGRTFYNEIEKSYKTLLNKLNKEGKDTLQNHTDAKRESEFMILTKHMEATINFMFENFNIITEEMDRAVGFVQKRRLIRYD